MLGALIILLVISTGFALSENSRANRLQQAIGASDQSTLEPAALLEEHGIVPLTNAESSQSTATTKDLNYLIEEEKLAHDVYVTLYEKWGARVFNNIKNSEATHQSMVLAVMESRGLADPRKSTVGVFTNSDLQALYDKLIAQGSQSQTEAYKVGVAIEELDISDLKVMLERLDPKDADIKSALENLLNGSENHLRAFNRQV